MDKSFYNVIYVLIVLTLLASFKKIFKNRKDSPTFNKIYRVILGVFWTIIAVVTILLYWVGYGCFKQGNSSIATELFVFGVLMTLSVGYKIYTTSGNKNEHN